MKFILKAFFLTILVAVFSNIRGSPTSTTCNSNKGYCIDTNEEACPGILKTGFCTGASNFVCCEPHTSCDSNKGYCIDTSTETCVGILKTGYCGGSSNIVCCESGLPERCYSGGPPLLNGSYEFTLRNQGFSGHPGALVYVPSNFNKFSTNIEVIVYIHGYNNCIRNIVRKTSDQCNCSINGDLRESYNLIGQFESACLAGGAQASNRLFVAAEVAYDQANDSPGHWADQGMMKAFLDELLIEHMSGIIKSPTIPVYDTSRISRLRIFSHSGGYFTIGDMAINGGMTAQVKELVLLDSLYANFDKFDAFVQNNIYNFGIDYSQFRFSSVYTQSGGTYANNQNMALRVEDMISLATSPPPNQVGSLPLVILDNSPDNSAATVEAEIQQYTSIFKLATCSHDDVARTFFYDFLVYTV